MDRLKDIVKLPLAVMLLGLLLPGLAAAGSTVTVDGIKSGSEYTGSMGGTTSGSRSLLWWNDHHSIYTYAAANMNDLFWEINDGGSNNVSLNIFVEVPTYARRMIWDDGCDYGGGSLSGCTDLAPGGDKSYLDAYYAGTHHSSVKMDYDTQTKSEYFKLNVGSQTGVDKKGNPEFNSIVDIHWQDVDGNGLDDDFTWKTSREYLVDDTMTCTKLLCQEFDRTSSLEVMWTGLADVAAATNLYMSITNMQLHLSDEARGLPDIEIPPVPVPAAVWLFGTALIGFIGIARRTNLS